MAKYRKYSKEFQLQAAKLVTEQGYSYKKPLKGLAEPPGRFASGSKSFARVANCPLQIRLSPRPMSYANYVKRSPSSRWRTTY